MREPLTGLAAGGILISHSYMPWLHVISCELLKKKIQALPCVEPNCRCGFLCKYIYTHQAVGSSSYSRCIENRETASGLPREIRLVVTEELITLGGPRRGRREKGRWGGCKSEKLSHESATTKSDDPRVARFSPFLGARSLNARARPVSSSLEVIDGPRPAADRTQWSPCAHSVYPVCPTYATNNCANFIFSVTQKKISK